MARKALQGQIRQVRQQATAQNQSNFGQLADWRVKLRLAPGSDYLYNAPGDVGILQPLRFTDGVIFPYTPQVQVQYTANYDTTEIVHSNYKIYQYKSSSVDSVSVTGDFTAQDNYEANYVLAVIHFLRSVTKMFYGQDSQPKNGTPPPLCYLTGLGEYQFNEHPLAVTGFTYSLPNDVDYIRATPRSLATANDAYSSFNSREPRLQGISPGGMNPEPQWSGDREFNAGGSEQPTYVPTKMQIQFTAVPIVSRLDISSRFSLKDYGNGSLLLGNKSPTGGGLW